MVLHLRFMESNALSYLCITFSYLGWDCLFVLNEKKREKKMANDSGLVNFQIKMSWSFTHPHVLQDVYVFISSVKNNLRLQVFDENNPGLLSL